jgi:hypothetical protein
VCGGVGENLRFSFRASSIRRMEPNSKMVAPMKAVQPPATDSSPGNSLHGAARGYQTKKPFITQTKQPAMVGQDGAPEFGE